MNHILIQGLEMVDGMEKDYMHLVILGEKMLMEKIL
jgi:hypothetical protein